MVPQWGGGSDIADRTNCRDSFDKLSVSVLSGQNPYRLHLPYISAKSLVVTSLIFGGCISNPNKKLPG